MGLFSHPPDGRNKALFSSRLLSFVRVRTMDRRADYSDRAIAIGFAARFTDEMGSGLFEVLAPTLRKTFGLSLAGVTLLYQVLSWVALVIEPPAALLIDVRSRRTLMTIGAACIATAVLLMGTAEGYGMLLAGFAVYGIGSGPLVGTADVILVEAFPDDPERAFSRGTMIDTVGALLAPAAVAAASWSGQSWRLPVLAIGIASLVYAGVIVSTSLPHPSRRAEPDHLMSELRANLGKVIGDPRARRWLLFLLGLEILEAPRVLRYVWLHDRVGMSQGLVAAYAVGEQLVALVSLALLDGWLVRRDSRHVLVAACLGTLVLYPAWLAAPGIAGRILVGVPLTACTTMLWPIAKARSLVSLPGRAGAVSAVANLFGVLPLALVLGVLAEKIGLTAAIVAFSVPSAAVLVLLSWWRPAESEDPR
jgi:MFS family permease